MTDENEKPNEEQPTEEERKAAEQAEADEKAAQEAFEQSFAETAEERGLTPKDPDPDPDKAKQTADTKPSEEKPEGTGDGKPKDEDPDKAKAKPSEQEDEFAKYRRRTDGRIGDLYSQLKKRDELIDGLMARLEEGDAAAAKAQQETDLQALKDKHKQELADAQQKFNDGDMELVDVLALKDKHIDELLKAQEKAAKAQPTKTETKPEDGKKSDGAEGAERDGDLTDDQKGVIAAIKEKHPDMDDLRQNEDFQTWVNKDPARVLVANSWDAQASISMIDSYKRYKKAADNRRKKDEEEAQRQALETGGKPKSAARQSPEELSEQQAYEAGFKEVAGVVSSPLA